MLTAVAIGLGVLGGVIEWHRPGWRPPGLAAALLTPLAILLLSWPLIGIGLMSALPVGLLLTVQRRWWRPMLPLAAAAIATNVAAQIVLAPEDWRDGQLGIGLTITWLTGLSAALTGAYLVSWLRPR